MYISQNIFVYTNLVNNTDRDQARFLLEEAGIPQENIDFFVQLVEKFYQDPYPNLVESGFQKAFLPMFSYRDTDAFQHSEIQPDYSLTCRMAAFLLLKDGIVFSDELKNSLQLDEKDPKSRRYLTDDDDLSHYDLLFSNLTGPSIRSSAEMSRVLIEYWKAAGILFPSESKDDKANAHLVMAYGSDGETIQNFHTAVVIYKDSEIWLLEKYDPIYPYQLSCFCEERQLVNYMKLRLKGIKYAAIFSENHCLWSRH